MKYYFGYDKPYIYAYCPHDCEGIMEEILTPLYEQDVMFCHGDQVSKKELRRVEAAHAVILFVNKTCPSDVDFHQVVNRAVQCGKNILTIYLEDVTLDSWGHMQLDSAQALFRHQLSDDEFTRKLAEAAIFRDMAVTQQQKQFQKRRGISLVAVPVLAAVLIFTTVVYPLMLAPKTIGIPGLKGLTQKELDQITELHICGDQVYKDVGSMDCRYTDNRTGIEVEVGQVDGIYFDNTNVTRGPVTDLSDLKRLRNLEVLEICAQQITDLTPIYGLTKLRKLAVGCNPITSLEGIEALQNLEVLNLTGTDVSDLTPLETLPQLRDLTIDGTYVKKLPNVETLEHINSLSAGNSDVRMSYVGAHRSLGLNISRLSYQLRDFSFLRDVNSFDYIICDDVYLSDLMPALMGKQIYRFEVSNIYGLTKITQLHGLKVNRALNVGHTDSLVSIEGIEKFNSVDEIELSYCHNLKDLTPLNNLKNVAIVRLSSDMRPLAETQLNDNVCFYIRYVDE